MLSLVCTREGTSATIIDNTRDKAGAAWGQRLFFNQDGQRAGFTGTRLSDFSTGGEHVAAGAGSQATSNGVVSEKDLAGIAAQINQVYADGDYVGSLVTGGQTQRPTEMSGDKNQPKGWWKAFWKQYDEKVKGKS